MAGRGLWTTGVLVSEILVALAESIAALTTGGGRVFAFGALFSLNTYGVLQNSIACKQLKFHIYDRYTIMQGASLILALEWPPDP